MFMAKPNVSQIRVVPAADGLAFVSTGGAVPQALASILSDYQDELLDATGALKMLENYLAEIDDGQCSDMMHALRGAARLVRRVAVDLDPAELASKMESRERRRAPDVRNTDEQDDHAHA
jgi:hypothetical protein